MGLEALSRHAKEVTFVENDRQALAALKANIETVGLGGRIVASDVDRFLDRSRGQFDLAFVDPPYAVPLASLVETMIRLLPLLSPQGTAIIHRRKGSEPPDPIGMLRLVDMRRYGSAELWRYTKEQK